HPRPEIRAKYSTSRVCHWRASQQKATPHDRYGSSATGAVKADRSSMSALPRKRTCANLARYVRLVPQADKAQCSKRQLLDHLVGAGEQHRWNFQAEGLRGLEINHELVLGRRLHRQVGRFLALEDAIDVAGRATELCDGIIPVRDQAARGDEVAPVIDRGKL